MCRSGRTYGIYMGKIAISANRPKRQLAANQKFHRLERKASTIAAKSGAWSS